MSSCNLCEIQGQYFYCDLLHQKADLLIVGESVTAQEARKNTCLTGAGAEILKNILVQEHFDEFTIEATTAIRCNTPKVKNKYNTEALKGCKRNLIDVICKVLPKVIMLCGSVPLQVLTGKFGTSLKVTSYYGYVKTLSELVDWSLSDYDPYVVVVRNPGIVLHKPNEIKLLIPEIQTVKKLLKGQETKAFTEEIQYKVVQTVDELGELYAEMKQLHKQGELTEVGMDIETTGLDYRVVEFLVLGLYWGGEFAYVIPRHLMEYIKAFIEDASWKCIWQNGKYDKKVLWKRDLANTQIDEDTQYLHYMLDETSEHNLGYLSKVFLGAEEYKYKMNQNWSSVSLDTYEQFFEALCERVAVDSVYTYQLKQVLTDKLKQSPSQYNCYKNLIIPAANFLTRVEQNGILLNPNILNNMDIKYSKQLEQMLATIGKEASKYYNRNSYMKVTGAKSAPEIFNPGSSQQLAYIIFDVLKLKPRIKKGRSTDADVLGSLDNPPALVTMIQEYRSVKKEHSTYVLGLLKLRDDDGRVRTNFTLHVTATGRLSSKEPNIQNQPSANGVGNIREAFIAPPGKILAEIDYSGAELRWLAFLSKCPVLSQVFKDGRNLHHETAVRLFGEGYDKAQKLRAKAVNFGIPYGRRAESMAKEHNVSIQEAQRWLDEWLNSYHGARDYLNWCSNQIYAPGWIETVWGRKRRFGFVSKKSENGLQNEARNFPIQSCSSDLTLYCAINLEEPLSKLGVKIINLVHDSILLELPDDEKIIHEVGKLCNEFMVNAPINLFDCDVPFKTDYEIGYTWYQTSGQAYDYTKPCGTDNMEIETPTHGAITTTFAEWRCQNCPSL